MVIKVESNESYSLLDEVNTYFKVNKDTDCIFISAIPGTKDDCNRYKITENSPFPTDPIMSVNRNENYSGKVSEFQIKYDLEYLKG